MRLKTYPGIFRLRDVFCILILGLLPAVAQTGQSGSGQARISVPGVQGFLELSVGHADWDAKVRSDGKEVKLQAMNREDHLLISAFLQRVDFPASPEKCREEWWSNTGESDRSRLGEVTDLRQSTRNGIARVEFVWVRIGEASLRQKNLHAYLGVRDLCAEIHLSKVLFKPEDQKLFEELLGTVKLSPDDSPAAPSEDAKNRLPYFRQGSRLFQEKNYPAAAEQYQKALDLEKLSPTLSKDLFRVLIDNLGMAYGLSGDLEKSKATLEYGLTQDSEYPMFYYNLACGYAEAGKMRESLAQLRLAYKYRANMIAGEGDVPDPLKDSSFREFVNNAEFVKAVREMQRP